MNLLFNFKRFRTIICLLISCLCFFTCDDGDIIIVEFDFEDTFSSCGDLVFFKTIEAPAQSFSLLLTTPTLTIDNLIETEADAINPNLVTLVNPELVYSLNTSSNIFNYRTYSNLPDNPFCNDIPPADLNVNQNEVSSGGIATIITKLEEDDGDGIPAEDEDLNNNGDYNDDDTDDDGIPNYLDIDDDGDNVLTETELRILDPNTDNDDNPLTNPLDTDDDGIPNYLDSDDDGDGFLTRDEETINQNQNPTDDITNNTIGPDYLNSAVKTNIPATKFRSHSIKQEFEISIILENISFPTISEDIINYGTLTNSKTTNTRTPIPIF